MNITAGGLVQNTTGMSDSSGAGTVHVDGLNSRWLNSGDLVVGYDPSSTGCWTSPTADEFRRMRITIGDDGDGTLTISSGGRVDEPDFGLGSSIKLRPGSVTVAGAGSTWTIDGNLRVGNDGHQQRGSRNAAHPAGRHGRRRRNYNSPPGRFGGP